MSLLHCVGLLPKALPKDMEVEWGGLDPVNYLPNFLPRC